MRNTDDPSDDDDRARDARSLCYFRKSIDDLDDALVAILAERFRLTEKIGIIKSRAEMDAADPAREREQTERYRELAACVGIDADIFVDVMLRVRKHVKDRHEALRKTG